MTRNQYSESLRNAQILIVEDEFIVALDLALMIEGVGGRVEGPLHRMEKAMAYDRVQTLDAAILDVDIAGCEVFPLADRLSASQVPIVFHTSRTDVSCLRDKYPDARIVLKPGSVRQVIGALHRAVCTTTPLPAVAS